MVHLEERRAEFRRYVWNHAADAFQAKFDLRANLTDEESASLVRTLSQTNLSSLPRLAAAVEAEVRTSKRTLTLLLQISGLTRNKIVQDLKAHARNTRVSISTSSPNSLFNGTQGAALASEYLARQLIRVFSPAEGQITPQLLEVANQATWLGYIRQERAKRMGHEAEYRAACLLRDCNLPFAPEEKAENPLCRDIQIDGVSYDLVAPSVSEPFVCVKCTVHTANIGQYGESKDALEIQEAAAAIAKSKRKNVTLIAMIDGVGFESNRAGLDTVLSIADEFVQFRTLWKVAAIVASKINRRLEIAIPREQLQDFAPFAARFGVRLNGIDGDVAAFRHWIAAGDGFIKR